MATATVPRLATAREIERASSLIEEFCRPRGVGVRVEPRAVRDPEFGGVPETVLEIRLSNAPAGPLIDFVLAMLRPLREAGLTGSRGPLHPDVIPEW